MKKAGVLCMGVILLASCHSKKERAATEPRYQLQEVLPAAIKADTPHRYYYTVTSGTTWEAEIDGRKIENVSTATVGLLYGVSRDSAGNRHITLTYDSLHIATQKDGVETESDALNAGKSISPVDDMLGVIKGAVIKVVVKRGGGIASVEGSKELVDKIMQRLQSHDEYTRKSVQTTIGRFIGEDFVSGNFGRTNAVFPDSPVYVGDTWSHKGVVNNTLNIISQTRYKLESAEGNVGTISARSEIENSEVPASADIIGKGVASLVMSGKDESTYKVDFHTGMIMESVNSGALKGTMQTMAGTEIPLVIKTSRKTMIHLR